jgi:hypothetical protein
MKIKTTIEDELRRLSALASKLCGELYLKHKAISTPLILLMAARTTHDAMLRKGTEFPDELKLYEKLRAVITRRLDAIQLQQNAEHLGAAAVDENDPDALLVPELTRLADLVRVVLASVDKETAFDIALATELANYIAVAEVKRSGHQEPAALQRYAFIRRHIDAMYPTVQAEMDKVINEGKD